MAIAAVLWGIGYFAQESIPGRALQRVAYDFLTASLRNITPSRVVIVYFDERTNKELFDKTGRSLDRRHHVDLLNRFHAAGVERVVYDVWFREPKNPSDDVMLAEAIGRHGRVILGGKVDYNVDAVAISAAEYEPYDLLMECAEGWGNSNTGTPDKDNVARRILVGSDHKPSLGRVAAMAELKTNFIAPAGRAWYNYAVSFPQRYNLVDCLDAKKVPDDVLRGQTVLVGSASPDDWVPGPYQPHVSHVDWHAMAFANFRDQLWFDSASTFGNVVMTLLFPVAWLLARTRAQPLWQQNMIIAVAAVLITLGCIYSNRNTGTLQNWLIVLVVQLPLGGIALIGDAVATRGTRVQRVQLFISCTSTEFGPHREALCRNLDRPNVTVKVQEQFFASGTETLEKLDDYIRACEAIIHLVGETTGAFPRDSAVTALLCRYPDLTSRMPALKEILATEGGRASYTQWEAYLAVYHRKMLLIATPKNRIETELLLATDNGERQSQQLHLARLRRMGRYAEIQFTNVESLVIDMLRSKLHDVLAGVNIG